MWPGKFVVPRKAKPPALGALFEAGPKRRPGPKPPTVRVVVGMPSDPAAKAPVAGDPGFGELFHFVEEGRDFEEVDSDDGRKKEDHEPDAADVPPPPAPPDAAASSGVHRPGGDEEGDLFGEPAAPPLPPPAAGPEALGARGPLGEYRSLSVAGGVLQFSVRLKQINAHCSDVLHLGGPKCKCDRKLKLADGSRRRPLGFLTAWLSSHKCTSKAEHDALKSSLAKADGFAARDEARSIIKELALQDSDNGRTARELLALEQEEGGDGSEPAAVR